MTFNYPGDKPFVPFEFPVPVPASDPDAGDMVSVCFSEEWLPYVLSCLKALSMEASWIGSDAEDIALACQRGDTLLGYFVSPSVGCGVITPTILCISGSFTDLDYGFSPNPGAGCDPTWISGTGWESCHDSGDDTEKLEVIRVFDNSTYLRSFTFDAHFNENTIGISIRVIVRLGSTSVYDNTFTNSGVHDWTVSDDVNAQADNIIIIASQDATYTPKIYLKAFGLCYTGDFPLAQSPETFEHTFDFTVDNGSWFPVPVSGFVDAVWTNGQGWVSQPSFFNPNYSYLNLLERDFPARQITGVTVYYSSSISANTGTRLFRCYLVSTQQFSGNLDSGSGSFVTSFVPNVLADELLINCDIGTTPSGSENTIISKVVVTGIGTDPF